MNNNFSAEANASAIRYPQFYRSVFLAEHRSTIAIATHVFGTLLGLAWVAWALYTEHYWLLLAFPILHAGPGLIGHRIAERNPNVGDVRITRKDFPLWWFIVGNHQMSWELIFKGAYWRAGQ